jgi:tetratricopeptide (TPR) repeat protein
MPPACLAGSLSFSYRLLYFIFVAQALYLQSKNYFMKKLHKLLILSALLLAAACSPSDEELSDKSRQLMNEAKYAEAISYLDRLLEQNPEKADAYNMRGVAYLEQGNTSDAISDFNQALRYDSASYRPVFNRGNAYRQQGELAQALQDYNQVVRKQPSMPDVYINRSAVLYEMKRYTEARHDLETAQELAPENPLVYLNLAKVNLLLEDTEAAKENLKEVLQRDAQNSTAFFLLGLTLLDEKNEEEACRYFKRAARLGNEEAKRAAEQNCP